MINIEETVAMKIKFTCAVAIRTNSVVAQREQVFKSK